LVNGINVVFNIKVIFSVRESFESSSGSITSGFDDGVIYGGYGVRSRFGGFGGGVFTRSSGGGFGGSNFFRGYRASYGLSFVIFGGSNGPLSGFFNSDIGVRRP